jgi:hypothetical protein
LHKLFAVIDETNDYEYLAFIIGLKEDIERNEERLPPNFTHMTRSCSTKSEKLALINKFDFNGNIQVYCVKFAIRQLKKKIDNEIIAKQKSRKPKHIIYNILGSEFRSIVQKMYSDFITNLGYSMNEIVFQVDNKIVQDLLKTASLRFEKPQNAHRIADCVAHINGKHWPTNDRIIEWDDSFKRLFHKTVISRIIR